MVDQLEPNPEGCNRFEPNPFKKEKCKACGHPWQSHKGAISNEQVAGFIKAKQDVIDKKGKAEAEAKAKTRAKAEAKKSRTQAVEDEWFFDGTTPLEEDADSDDGLGFWSSSAAQETPPRSGASEHKPLKVKNLIDFSECDVAEEEPAAPSPSSRATLPLQQRPEHLLAVAASSSSQPTLHGAAATASDLIGPASCFSNEAALLSEIEHLRQVLADSNEEKNIQVAFFRDELTDKQQLIDELKRQQSQAQAELEASRAREELACVAVGKADAFASETLLLQGSQDEVPTTTMAEELEQAQQLATSERARFLVEAETQREEIQDLRRQLEQARKSSEALRDEAAATAAVGPPVLLHPPAEVVVAGAGTISVNGRYRILPEIVQGERPVYAHEERKGYKIQWSEGRQFWMVDDVEGDAPYKVDGRSDVSLPLDAVWSVYQGGLLPAPSVGRGAAEAPGSAPPAADPLDDDGRRLLLADLQTLSSQTRHILTTEITSAPAASPRVEEEKPATEAPEQQQQQRQQQQQLSGLKGSITAANVAAERHMAERRLLISKLQGLGLSSLSPEVEAVVTAKAKAGSEASLTVSRQAALALREVRLNAERQLSWITQRRRFAR